MDTEHVFFILGVILTILVEIIAVAAYRIFCIVMS